MTQLMVSNQFVSVRKKPFLPTSEQHQNGLIVHQEWLFLGEDFQLVKRTWKMVVSQFTD